MAATKRNPPRNRNELRPVDKAFIHSIMFEMGILPIEDPALDMSTPLKQMTKEEARVLKRKFRKVWRKCMKAEVGTARGAEQRESNMKRQLGVGKHVPSKAEKRERKRIVYEKIWNEVIVPMLVKFENPERTPTKVEDAKTPQ